MKKIATTIAAALAIAAAASPASATGSYERFRVGDAEWERLTSREFDRCMDASGGVTLNMRECSSVEYGRLDRRLNAVYRTAMARLPDRAARHRLRALERRWLVARQEQCDRVFTRFGGTIEFLDYDACALDELVRRIAWLERYSR